LFFEISERLCDGFDEVFECSRGGLSQRCFELGGRLFGLSIILERSTASASRDRVRRVRLRFTGGLPAAAKGQGICKRSLWHSVAAEIKGV
jgi:hypothetical protein